MVGEPVQRRRREGGRGAGTPTPRWLSRCRHGRQGNPTCPGGIPGGQAGWKSWYEHRYATVVSTGDGLVRVVEDGDGHREIRIGVDLLLSSDAVPLFEKRKCHPG